MNATSLTGLLGSLLLVCGAALPDHPTRTPTRSPKNWLFAGGAFVMLVYAFLGYRTGGSIFFVILELFMNGASILMFLPLPEKTDIALIVSGGIAFVLWALILSTGLDAIIFVVGLSCIAAGYTLHAGTMRREVALAAGSALVAFFSFLNGNWIFCWLNLFFAGFSTFYACKQACKQ